MVRDGTKLQIPHGLRVNLNILVYMSRSHVWTEIIRDLYELGCKRLFLLSNFGGLCLYQMTLTPPHYSLYRFPGFLYLHDLRQSS
jgi:hypothetical protein